ncbi:MAG: SIMPL domain-containing protein [Byssovorax sp.]
MSTHQAIPHPSGVSVFGSSIVRVEPDVSSLSFAVVALKPTPTEAFSDVRAGADAVRAFLLRAQLTDVASSRISLKQEHRYTSGEQRFVGYLARTGFHLILRELDRIEEILVGVVAAGASEITGVDLQTSRLKEARAKARRRAVDAAREKALVYCLAAGVTLGVPLHIEDVNPDVLTGAREGHVATGKPQSEDVGTLRAFDPGWISISAAVQIVYSFSPPPTEGARG